MDDIVISWTLSRVRLLKVVNFPTQGGENGPKGAGKKAALE